MVGPRCARRHSSTPTSSMPFSYPTPAACRAGGITLRLADASTRPVVERLAQLERHDLSRLTGDLPGPAGLFEFPRLSRLAGGCQR